MSLPVAVSPIAGDPVAVRVGLDLVSVAWVEESLLAHGRRYLDRVYRPLEVEACRGPGGLVAARLAGWFAAKEAAMKVLACPEAALPWTDFEVRRSGGVAGLWLSGAAATVAEAMRIETLALSLTHTRGCAAAVVIAEIAGSADV